MTDYDYELSRAWHAFHRSHPNVTFYSFATAFQAGWKARGE